MIMAKIEGGLGNQMFIYAATRALAIRTGTELVLDTVNGYRDDRYGRRYQLDLFNLAAREATPKEAAAFALGSRRLYWRRKIDRLRPLNQRRFVEEQSLFDAWMLDYRPRRDIYLTGYWQRAAYFQEATDALRKEFSWKAPHSGENREWAAKMQGCASVFLHARRNAYEYLLPGSYYCEALRQVAGEVKDPVFFVFSDDPDWVRREIVFPGEVHFLSQNGEEANDEDLWLMTQCRHAIVANSSFSWWGAWLGDTTQRVVVAPDQWGYRAAAAPGWLTLDVEFERKP